MKVEFICPICKKVLIVTPSRKKRRKTCSQKCAHKLSPRRYWLGKKRSKKTNDKISKTKQGSIPWNKGIAYHQIRAEKHYQWKGGIKSNGRYIWIYRPNHPNAYKHYVPEHRLIMEKKLKRFLTKKEVVHHINGNSKDNRIKNLIVFKNNGEHLKHHFKERKRMNYNWQ